MLDIFSPLDGDYISFKHAALLIARERPGIEPDDIMDTLKGATFGGEFNHLVTGVPGLSPGADANWLHLRFLVPPPERVSPDLPLEEQPHRHYGVDAFTIADVLTDYKALPGGLNDWPVFREWEHSNDELRAKALNALAQIPFRAYPEKGQAMLGNIILSKAKLRVWMTAKGYALPEFLNDGPDGTPEPDAASLGTEFPDKLSSSKSNGMSPPSGKSTNGATAGARDSTEDMRGRPQKAAWKRIRELVRELHTASPTTKRSALASDAREKAKLEFDEKDLPSANTIVRQMKNILGAEG
ncbi:MAG: hypothetical protein P4L57_13505 [Rhizomicrobium sp.]|nr:hypothetical protein [Rhizomicrobium sp.]